MLRVGTVPYLVARPLTAGLAEHPGVRLRSAPPAELAELLRRGELDVALASSVLAIDPDLQPAGGAGFQLWRDGPVIASRGPIRSVLLFLRPGLCGPHKVERLALDPHSRSGRALARIVLEDAYHADFEEVEVQAGRDAFAGGADAVQLIGDPALEARIDHPDWEVVDLGETWWALTRLPFVFAGWIGRPGWEPSQAAEVLLPAAQSGLAQREALARDYATSTEEHAFLRRYLLEDLCYCLPGAEIEAALAEFRRRLRPAKFPVAWSSPDIA